MPEQLSNNQDQIEMAKISPREARIPKPVELTSEEDAVLVDVLRKAKTAEQTGNKSEAIKLYQVYQDQYEAIRTQRALEKRGEREVSPEVLEKNQKMLDFVFGTGRFDLEKEYTDGNIVLPSTEQRELSEKEGYNLELIVPGNITREEIITAVKEKYKTEFSSEGIYNYAEDDTKKTDAVINPNRPESFYTLLLKSQAEVNVASGEEVMNKTPQQLQEILIQKQAENPDLNLKGLNLSEYLLLDAYHFTQEKNHLNEQKWEYLLEEMVSGTGRALIADWHSVARGVRVFSDSGAGSDGGSRFAAVSACLKANLES